MRIYCSRGGLMATINTDAPPFKIDQLCNGSYVLNENEFHFSDNCDGCPRIGTDKKAVVRRKNANLRNRVPRVRK